MYFPPRRVWPGSCLKSLQMSVAPLSSKSSKTDGLPVLQATALVKKMRGGAQAHLLLCGNSAYVVKFQNNPQHGRVLIGEHIGIQLLKYLGVAVPEPALIRVGEELLAREPGIDISLGRDVTVRPVGLHLGTRFPGNPETEAVYDYVPDAMMRQVYNIRDFIGAFVFDRWAANLDARQAIFFRASARTVVEGTDTRSCRYACQMVDNGYVFGGPEWGFRRAAPLHGTYWQPAVYSGVTAWADFEPWLERVQSIPESRVEGLIRSVPREWIQHKKDEFELERLATQLLDRRSRVVDLIEETLSANPGLFRSWRADGPKARAAGAAHVA